MPERLFKLTVYHPACIVRSLQSIGQLFIMLATLFNYFIMGACPVKFYSRCDAFWNIIILYSVIVT